MAFRRPSAIVLKMGQGSAITRGVPTARVTDAALVSHLISRTKLQLRELKQPRKGLDLEHSWILARIHRSGLTQIRSTERRMRTKSSDLVAAQLKGLIRSREMKPAKLC